MNLVLSAAQEQPWSRALRIGLEKYGDTPIFDALVADVEAKAASDRVLFDALVAVVQAEGQAAAAKPKKPAAKRAPKKRATS